jgi:hypothetical protein
VLNDFRENVANAYVERIIGNAIGLTAALEELKTKISAMREKEMAVLAQKFSRAEEKFRFLK